MPWKKVTIAGVGLLGGSLGMALKRRGLAEEVTGLVRRRAAIREVVQSGAADRATLDVPDAVRHADLVVLCTPVAQMASLLEQMLPHLRPGAVITDVGSVKGKLVRQLEVLAARVRAQFIGSHPMAGSERTGVKAAKPDLFANAICVVTPTAKSHPAATRAVERLWRSLGGRVLRLTPEAHDAIVSRTSHLVQIAAATLVHSVLNADNSTVAAQLCATGFRDTTRIASGSPEMWRDIALANREHLGRAVSAYIQRLQRFKRMLQSQNSAAVHAFFQEAAARRNRWCIRANRRLTTSSARGTAAR